MRLHSFIKTAFTLAIVTLANVSQAQQTPANVPNNVGAPPETEIYLANLNITGDKASATQPKNVTNHKGYDNQPYFLPDSKAFLYTSENVGARMDIWKYNLTDGSKTQLTNTPNNSEYSPKLTPDGKGISVIFEQENRGGQEVRQYLRNETVQSNPMLDLSPVGYHAWGKGMRYLAVFALGTPSTLRLADRESGKIDIMYENIGRALFALPDASGYTFTERLENNQFRVLHLDIASRKITPLFTLPGENEHYALVPNSSAPLGVSFISANGSKLYYRKNIKSDWQVVADFEKSGVKNISRLAVSPDKTKLAFVTGD